MSLQQSLFSVEPVLLPQNNVRDHSQDYFNQEPNLATIIDGNWIREKDLQHKKNVNTGRPPLTWFSQ